MRGTPISWELRNVDLILLAGHWATGSDQLEVLRVVERRGFVWSDRFQLTPADLTQRIEAGANVYTGRELGSPGDFQLADKVGLMDGGLRIGTTPLAKDGTSLPRF